MIYAMKAADTIDLVDLGPWRTGADEKTALRLVEAMRHTGFVYITGHGVPATTVADVFDAAQQLFSQSPEQLDAVHYRHAMNYHGWVPRRNTPAAYHELFDLGVDIPSSYEGPGAELRTAPNLWPQGLPTFRPSIERYQGEMRDLADSVLGAIAVGLSLPADFFKVRCSEPHAQMRLLHYLQVPDTGEEVFSVGRHSDYEAVTILAHDDVGGLQVWGQDENWIDVPPIDGAFVVNAGDMLARWTNDVIPAGQHRVVSPTASERYAVAFFYATSYDVDIVPAVQPARPDGRVYEPVTTGAFMYMRFKEEGM